MWLLALASIYSVIFVPSLQQLCSGMCGTYININVTVPEPVIIPCGDIQLSNTSTADYCNATDGVNQPLAEAATTLYNLTVTEISHFNNVIYCTDNQNKIFCYRLTVFFAPYVPSDFAPSTVSRTDADLQIILICPFRNSGNPLPVCTWSRIDSRNISHQLILNGTTYSTDQYDCIIRIRFSEDDNGLYQCTGHNEVGNTTYTFPNRFIVERCSRLRYVTPSLVVSELPLSDANENVTILCSGLSVTRNASLSWMVDGIAYSSSGVFTSSRGQLVIEQLPFDDSDCMISSSLTVLNVQPNSQGIYTCLVHDNDFIVSKNESLMLLSQMSDSTNGTSLAPIIGGALAGIVGFLLILVILIAIAALYYKRNQRPSQPNNFSLVIDN